MEEDAALQKSLKKDVKTICWVLRKKYIQVLSALVTAEKKKKPSIESMFDDVYDVLTPELERQKAELMDHLKQYGKHYNMDQFAK